MSLKKIKKEQIEALPSKIKNAANIDQFTYLLDDGFQIAGSGDTTVSFDATNKRITITSIPGSGGGGAVTSFNGRTGGVVATEGDYSLNLLGDVQITSPVNNDFLQYNSSLTQWQNKVLNTGAVPESSNLYYTNARGIGSVLTGYTSGAGTISSSDSILQAIQKLNGNDGLKANLSGGNSFTGNQQITGNISASGLATISGNVVGGGFIKTGAPATNLLLADGTDISQSTFALASHTHSISQVTGLQTALDSKQNTLVSGTNIKTVNGKNILGTGDTNLTTSDITEGTNLYFTLARADSAVDNNVNVQANTAARHNALTLGTANGLSLAAQVLSLGLASASTNGALSSTDWTTFNNKFNTPTGLTTNFLPKWNGSAFVNSQVFDNGTNVGIGTTTPTLSKLQVKGDDGNVLGYFYNNTGTAGQVKGVVIEAGTNASDYALIVNSSSGSPYYKINGNGNHLFGTTTDNLVDKVQVNGSGSFSGNLKLGNPQVSNQKLNVDGSIVSIDNKLQYLRMGMEGDVAVITTDWFSGAGGSARPMEFKTGGVTRFTIDQVGNIIANNSITASPATASNQVVVKSQLDAAVRPYKVYTALLTQTGTNAPVATVLENTLGGTITWTRNSTGVFYGTLSGAIFTGNKTVKFGTLGFTSNLDSTIEIESTNTSIVAVITKVNGTQTDSVMSNGGTSIEIRVYN